MATALMNRTRTTAELVYCAGVADQLLQSIGRQARQSTYALARQVRRRTANVSHARQALVKGGLLRGRPDFDTEPAWRLISDVTSATSVVRDVPADWRRGRRRFVADLVKQAARLLPSLRALRGEGNVPATLSLAWQWHAKRTGRTYHAPRVPSREQIREAADAIARLMEQHDRLEDSWLEIRADRETFLLNVDLCVRPVIALESELFRSLQRLHSLTCEDPQ
jgi:hypothetical protein